MKQAHTARVKDFVLTLRVQVKAPSRKDAEVIAHDLVQQIEDNSGGTYQRFNTKVTELKHG